MKIIILSVLSVAVLGGAGYGIYRAVQNNNKEDEVVSITEEPIAGPQAEGQNVTVFRASIQAGAVNFSSTQEEIIAGYSAPTYINLRSAKKMEKVAMENLKIDNLNAVGDCTVTEKDASVAAYAPGAPQLGYVSFKLSCRTGVTYTLNSVLNTGSSWEGSKLLSYGGLTPAMLTRSLSFDVAIKFDDGTMTKKTFSGAIDGAKLSNGDFGSGTISGEGELF